MKIRHIAVTMEWFKNIFKYGTRDTEVVENKFCGDEFLFNVEVDVFDKAIHFYFLTNDSSCPELVEGKKFSDYPMMLPLFKTVIVNENV